MHRQPNARSAFATHSACQRESPPSLKELRRAAFPMPSACQPKPWRRLVEAAGVEPASEKVCREKTTCVSGSVVFVRPLRNRQERDGLVRLISAFRSETEALDLSCKMTLRNQVQALWPRAAT